jgi:hypothetical protein
MIRALTILAAVAVLAVTATPASAGTSKKPPPRTVIVVTDHGFVEAASIRPGNVENIDPFVGMVKATVGGAAKVTNRDSAGHT